MPGTAPEIFLSRAEVAERLRVSECTVRRYAKAGLLDERPVGPRLRRITERSVDALTRGDDDRGQAA